MEPEPSTGRTLAAQLMADGDLALDEVSGLLTACPADERFQGVVDALLSGSAELTARAAIELEPAVWTFAARKAIVERLEEAGLGRLATDRRLGPAIVYRAALRAVICSDVHREYIADLEEQLARVPPSHHRQLALQLAPTAIPAAWLPLQAADQDATAFVQSFPLPGRVTIDVAAACATWLSLRWDAPHRRGGVRRGLLMIGGAWPHEFPLASRALLALAGEAIPDRPEHDEPWVRMMHGIARSHLDGGT